MIVERVHTTLRCTAQPFGAPCGQGTLTLVDGEPMCARHRERTRRVVCRRCDERRELGDTALVARKVGGSYNRAARWQDCRICLSCVQVLLDHASEGHRSVSGWSLRGLRRAAAQE